MNCPKCGDRSAVIDTRLQKEGVLRRRGCLTCGTRWTTMERCAGALRSGRVPKKLRSNTAPKKIAPSPSQQFALVEDSAQRSAEANSLPLAKYLTLRKTAREEARQSGQPSIEVYARFGVLSRREKVSLVAKKVTK